MTKTNQINCLNFPQTKYAELIEANLNINEVIHKEYFSFCYLTDDSNHNRVLLRKILNNLNGHCIIVSGDKEVSFLAWKANVLGFLYHKSDEYFNINLLNERLKKYPPISEKVNEKLKINFKGGFDLVDIDAICFCIGSGNYTDIYLDNGTKKCISYPLSNLENRLQKVPFLKRVGKSFIVNINKIKTVKTEYVIFKGKTDIELKLGSIYIKRIKQNLLWY